MIQQAISKAIEGVSLTEAEAWIPTGMEAMEGIMSGDATPAQIGSRPSWSPFG